MKNLGIFGYIKIVSYTAAGALGSTHNARLLKDSSIFYKTLKGDVPLGRVISLGDFGYVLLVMFGDSVFLQFSWLIKGYNENTRDAQQQYFNERLCGARFVIENAY